MPGMSIISGVILWVLSLICLLIYSAKIYYHESGTIAETEKTEPDDF